jgi:excisionase family DNA binding protein
MGVSVAESPEFGESSKFLEDVRTAARALGDDLPDCPVRRVFRVLPGGGMASGQDEYLSTSEAAAILGIGEDAVREAFDRGDLTGMRTRPGPGGHRRPSRVSVEAYRRALRGEDQPSA